MSLFKKWTNTIQTANRNTNKLAAYRYLFCLFVCLFGWLVGWLVGCLVVCLFVFVFVCFFVCLFVCLFVCVFVCFGVVCLCVCFLFVFCRGVDGGRCRKCYCLALLLFLCTLAKLLQWCSLADLQHAVIVRYLFTLTLNARSVQSADELKALRPGT